MINVEESLGTARVIVLKPGDILVLEMPGDVSQKLAAAIKERVQTHPGLEDHDVLILGGGARLSTLRPA